LQNGRDQSADIVTSLSRDPRNEPLLLSPISAAQRGEAGALAGGRKHYRSRHAIRLSRARKIRCAVPQSLWGASVTDQATGSVGSLLLDRHHDVPHPVNERDEFRAVRMMAFSDRCPSTGMLRRSDRPPLSHSLMRGQVRCRRKPTCGFAATTWKSFRFIVPLRAQA
jgi:hypothetical protein